jgi:hypothetical protein
MPRGPQTFNEWKPTADQDKPIRLLYIYLVLRHAELAETTSSPALAR